MGIRYENGRSLIKIGGVRNIAPHDDKTEKALPLKNRE